MKAGNETRYLFKNIRQSTGLTRRLFKLYLPGVLDIGEKILVGTQTLHTKSLVT